MDQASGSVRSNINSWPTLRLESRQKPGTDGGLTLGNTSNYPLMGGKSFPFEAGMRVPFIAKWPGRIKPGICRERIIGMDIYPTMLAAAGLPLRPKQHSDGINLVPLLTEAKPLQNRPIIFHFPHYTHATGPFSPIIANHWKLIRFYNHEKGAHLLYNLAEDSAEQHDQAATNPEMLDKLSRQLDASLTGMEAEMPIPNAEFNPGTKGKRMNLKFTRNLAEKERTLFRERLKNSQAESP